jgi:hypothetical protein
MKKTKNTDGSAEKRTSMRSASGKAPRKARAGVELDAGAQARIKAGVEKALQPVAEVASGEPEPGAAPPPVQPELPAQPEPAETSGGTDAAETSGGTDAAETSGAPEPGEVAPPVAEAPSGAPEPDAVETSGEADASLAQPSAEADASPAQPSTESKAAEPEATPPEKAPAPKMARAPKAKAPPAPPAPAQPAASGPIPAWRSSPARILRSALSPLDPRWYDWEKLESQIPGVREARALLQTAYETATRLEKAAASGKPAARKVEPGALVRVRAKHAPGYAPLADVTGVLRVTGVAGGQAKVETARGEAVLLPMAHLELAEVAA